MAGVYENNMLSLGKLLDTQFRESPDHFKKLVATSEITEKIGASVYQVMVRLKICVAIETLPKEIKQELWDEAKAWCPGAEKEKLINVCKLIWVIEHL